MGVCFVLLAYFGILMPGVPAIPFIVLAAFFFANSSPKLHQWLLRQKLIGRLLQKLDSGRGRLASKLFIISQLWVSIVVALFIFVQSLNTALIVVVAGLIFSYIIFRLLDMKF